MYRKIISPIIFSLLLAIVAPILQAQGTGSEQVERLRLELERTDEILIRARDAVSASFSPTGRLALEEAKRVRDKSWDNFRGHRYSQAFEQTKLARQLAEKAIAAAMAARTTDENGDLVLRKLEHTRQLMERVRENAPETTPRQLRTLFKAAQTNLEHAWEFYRKGQFRPAIKLCNQVENTLRKIVEMGRRNRSGSDHFDRRFNQVKETMERLTGLMENCESPEATRLATEAERLLRQARKLYESDKQQAAVSTLQKANQMIHRAVEECLGRGRFERYYEHLKSEISKISDLLDPTSQREIELLTKINRQMELAKKSFEQGNLQGANAALRAASQLLNQLQKQVWNG